MPTGTENFCPLRKQSKRGAANTSCEVEKTTSFQGTPPASRVVVLQFESMDKAQAWWDSPGRKNSQPIGDKYATFRIFAVEGATP
jgi:uncharacterized protein (DUF1330 family)